MNFKRNMIFAFLIYFCLLILYYHQTHEYAIKQAETRVEDLLRNYQAVRNYISMHQKQEVYNLQHQNILNDDYFSPEFLSSTYGARKVNEFYNEIRKKNDEPPIKIKFAAKNPRNIANLATQKESRLLDLFNEGKIKGPYKEIADTPEGKMLYYVLPTKKNTQQCMRCHSNPNLAPKGLLDKYGAQNGFFEKPGDIRAILLTTVSLEDDIKAANRLFLYLSIITMLILMIIILIARKFTNSLEKESKNLSSILDSQDNILVLSDGFKIVRANQTFLDFFNSKSLDEFKKKHTCLCKMFLEKEGYYSNRMLNKDQNWIEYMLSLPLRKRKVAIKDTGGNDHLFTVKISTYDISRHLMVISFTDITEIEELNNQLEKLVEKKTLELQKLNLDLENRIKREVEKNINIEKKLFASQKMASMGELIANIAHQWRQPLNAASVSAALIKAQKELGQLDNDTLRESLECIERNIQFMSSTIEDFKSFDTVEETEKTKIDISQIIEKDIRILKRGLDDIGITVIKDIRKDIEIIGYENELTQVVVGIINNAKDALTETNIVNKYIFISLYKENDKSAVIQIKDNAGGIPEDIKDKIFDPYFTTKHQSQGKGLGLYMINKIITESFKGAIGAKNITFYHNNESYKGLEFTIVLPI